MDLTDFELSELPSFNSIKWDNIINKGKAYQVELNNNILSIEKLKEDKVNII